MNQQQQYKAKVRTRTVENALESVENELAALKRRGMLRSHSHKLSMAVEALLATIEGEL